MSSVETEQIPRTRMPAAERRELILSEATAVFAANGYGGTTTDLVAQASGVSQPYVVRMFGTKEKLFLEVLARAERLLAETFLGAIEEARRAEAADTVASRAGAVGAEPGSLHERLGMAYVGLIAERGLHQVLAQAFLLGGDPVIGPEARACFLRTWQLIRDKARFDEHETKQFFANGMLINTLVALRLAGGHGENPEVDAMFAVAFPCSFETYASHLPTADEPY
ncbi:TetR/AcrR family transcriptional regulator [Sinomonas sp. P10A9]|uniref:TetR/AcrR family transcriptional regulator n=1 Tax=Sinomonas puerhi TaxID=3238584 RepID=A0AB39L3I9_9MICC